ncbi:MAG: hypothetical protein IJL98_07180 [Lachnospiraceae bacterium]|nr:hypothetical protein [Lachnospiraceae bacterium]
MSGDYPGEAQDFYAGYLDGGKVYDIKGLTGSEKLYYKNGVALFLLGEGKVAAALNTSAVLSDERFDFSRAYILSTGCGGAAEGYGTFGEVFVITAAVDYDLGHHADPREMGRDAETTWFHDESFDPGAVVHLDRNLTDRVFGMVENVPLDTTEKTMEFIRKEYLEEAWAQRQPQVMKGTAVSGDNYWKGAYDHQNALLITESYNCPDPYAITEMEDVAVGLAVKRFGMLDRLIVLRAAVNLDVFPAGVTPEMLWGDEEQHIASINSIESVDIFETAMKNCFKVGKVLIDAILEGKL